MIAIFKLTNLQTLHLFNNQLSSLPAEIFKLTNLQTLDFRVQDPEETETLYEAKLLIRPLAKV